ncbi:nuclear pore-associated protein 1-like isoform X3 [Balaenoptera acutorostrata]|uniref:Nuclear pore-associated protein 1-like isoform X3 n=1 Tax=Balaenoptera acutorostrata TaxID=9767 RepID=A0ABM3SZX4_BALAC|nr:nuclear pore-associated protein 1-like isoform X3 [Balaenoptera acutorostrata]
MECHSTRLSCSVRARPREELEAREQLSHFHSLFSDQAGSSSDMEAMDTTPPSWAVTVHSAPVFPSPPFTASAAIGHSAGGTSDPEAMDTTPPSRAVTVYSAPVFPSPPFTASAAIGHSAGSTSDPEAMDTTPPSRAVTVHSAPVFPSPAFTASAAIGHSAGGTSDPEAMDTTPPSWAVTVHSAPVFPSPPFTASAAIGHSAGGTSDPEAMDTTPPSRAVIVQSAPSPSRTTTHFTPLFQVLGTHHPVVAMPQPVPRLSYLKRRPKDRPTFQSYDRKLRESWYQDRRMKNLESPWLIQRREKEKHRRERK